MGLTADELRAYDADIILVAPCGFDRKRAAADGEKMWRHDWWRELRAVKEGKVTGAYRTRADPSSGDSERAHFARLNIYARTLLRVKNKNYDVQFGVCYRDLVLRGWVCCTAVVVVHFAASSLDDYPVGVFVR